MNGDTIASSSNDTTKEPWVEPTVTFLCAEDVANIQPCLISGGGGGGGGYGGGGGSGGGNTTGTESHPEVLSPGVSAPTASGTERWYQCSTIGAVDVSASTSRTGHITVKKNALLLGYDTIDQRSGQTLNETYVNYGLNTYKVGISSSSTSTLNCRISQHEDVCPSPISSQDTVLWTHTGGGNMYALSGVIAYHPYVWYTTAQGVSGLVDVISFNDYLDYVSNILNGSWSVEAAVASFMAARLLPPPYSTYVSSIGFAFTIISAVATVLGMGSIDFTQDKIDEIRTCGDVYYDDSIPRYRNGVKMSMFTESGVGSTGVQTFDVESWYGGQMVGAKGEVGTWS